MRCLQFFLIWLSDCFVISYCKLNVLSLHLNLYLYLYTTTCINLYTPFFNTPY